MISGPAEGEEVGLYTGGALVTIGPERYVAERYVELF